MKFSKLIRISALVGVIGSVIFAPIIFVTVPLLYGISKIHRTEEPGKEKSLVLFLLYPLSAAVIAGFVGAIMLGGGIFLVTDGSLMDDGFGLLALAGNILVIMLISFLVFVFAGLVRLSMSRSKNVPIDINYRIAKMSAAVSVFSIIVIEILIVVSLFTII